VRRPAYEISRDPRRARAGAFVVLALVAEWAAHAATWYLTGGATPGHALSGATHTYLGPVGLLLAGLAAAASWSVWRGLRGLVAVARSFEAAIRRPRRDHPGAPAGVAGSARGPGSVAAAARIGARRVWAALLCVQLVVYVVQENVEAHAAGLGTPGLHVLTAHHGSALFVHAAIALLGAMLAVELGDRWIARAHAVVVAVRAYRAVTWRRALAPAGPRHDAVVSDSPLERVGRSILSRPPPLLTSA
jgi:hypothetical protein